MLPLFIKAGFEAYPGQDVRDFAEYLFHVSYWIGGVVVGIHNDAPMFVIPGMKRADIIRQWEAVHFRAALSAPSTEKVRG